MLGRVQFNVSQKMEGATFCFLIVTIIKGFMVVSSDKVCYIVSEFDPLSSSRQHRWSLPYSDPCECTSIRLGGAVSQDMSGCLKGKPLYLETLILSEDPDETRAIFECPPVCSNPLGMESRLIPDSSLTASNDGNADYGPNKARLNDHAAWCSIDKYTSPWFQVLLDETVTLTGIVTQGRHSSDVWTKTFKVKLGVTDNQLEYVTGTNRLTIEFSGNTDSDTPVTNWFPEAVRAKVIRIEPITKQRGFCIRFELLGCRDSE